MAQINNAFHPRIPRYGRLTHDQDRLGLTTSFQFQAQREEPVQPGRPVLRLQRQARRGLSRGVFVQPQRFAGRQAADGGRNAEIGADGTLVYGLFDDVDIRSEARHDELETRFYSVALSGEHEFNDQWSLDELVGYSRSDFNNPIQTTVTLDRSNSDGYSYDYRDSSRLPAFNYNFDVTNAANWSFANLGGGYSSEIRLRPQGVDNTFQVAKVDLNFAPTDNWKFKLGLDYKKYDFVSWEQRRASETDGARPARRHDAGQHDRAAQGIR